MMAPGGEVAVSAVQLNGGMLSSAGRQGMGVRLESDHDVQISANREHQLMMHADAVSMASYQHAVLQSSGGAVQLETGWNGKVEVDSATLPSGAYMSGSTAGSLSALTGMVIRSPRGLTLESSGMDTGLTMVGQSVQLQSNSSVRASAKQVQLDSGWGQHVTLQASGAQVALGAGLAASGGSTVGLDRLSGVLLGSGALNVEVAAAAGKARAPDMGADGEAKAMHSGDL